GRHNNRRQDLVQPVAPHLEPGRQAESGADLLGRLVDGEARTVGGDLEQDATRLAEIDRFEIPAVDHRGHVAAGCQQRVSPPHLCIRAWSPLGDDMKGYTLTVTRRS